MNGIFLLLQLMILYSASMTLNVHGTIKQLLLQNGNAVWNHVESHTGFQMIGAAIV